MRLEVFMAKDGETKSFQRVFVQGKLLRAVGRVPLLSVNPLWHAPALCHFTVSTASRGRYHSLSCTDNKSEIREESS